MLRKFESLLPAFLKRLDKHLLLNHPLVWASKIHYVIFFTAVGAGLILLSTFLMPVNTGNLPAVEMHFGILFIPLAIAFIFYAWRLSLFNVEKQFGEKTLFYSLKQQGLHGLSILLMASLPFLYLYSANDKIADSVSDIEFFEDVNTLNLGDYTQHQKDWSSDNPIGYTPYYFSHSDASRLLEMRELWENGDHEDIESRYFHSMKKYDSEFDVLLGDPVPFDYGTSAWRVDQALEKISMVKYHQLDSVFYRAVFFKIFLFVLGSLWLMLTVFTKTQPLTFFFSIVAGCVALAALSLGTALISAYTPMRGDEPFFFLYTALFSSLLFVVYRKQNSKRSLLWKNISLILVVAMVVGFPGALSLKIISYMNDERIIDTMLLGLGIAVILWNLFFDKRFSKMMATPINY